MKAPFLRYRVVLDALSPIHIGSGQAVEPWQYAFEEYQGSTFLLLLDVDALLASLSEADRLEFLRRCDSANPLTARDWLGERFKRVGQTATQPVKAAIQIPKSAFRELTQAGPAGDRANEIQLFVRDEASGEPFIPGSALKGAIRTALVAAAARTADTGTLKAFSGDTRSSATFEAVALGHTKPARDGRLQADLYRDPLRQLAFSDMRLSENSTVIRRMKIVSLSGREPGPGTGAEGIQMYREVTWSELNNETVRATGELRIHDRLTDLARAGSQRLPKTFDIGSVCTACNDFYRPLLAQELTKFLPSASFRPALEQARDTLASNQCLVRIGRHSHFEAMTIPGFFRAPERGVGKTRTYADGRFPLGWARLTFEAWP